jgi:hypothetical protein
MWKFIIFKKIVNGFCKVIPVAISKINFVPLQSHFSVYFLSWVVHHFLPLCLLFHFFFLCVTIIARSLSQPYFSHLDNLFCNEELLEWFYFPFLFSSIWYSVEFLQWYKLIRLVCFPGKIIEILALEGWNMFYLCYF